MTRQPVPSATRAPDPARAVGRRALVLGGLGVALGGPTVAGCTRADPAAAPLPATPSGAGPGPSVPPWHGDERVRAERFRSEARGREVALVVVRPPGHEQGDLPVCLALHGRYATSQQILDTYLPARLGTAVASGVPPFAVVAVDGGNSYWHALDAGDDPLRMLTDELPGLLMERGLATATRGAPSAVRASRWGASGPCATPEPAPPRASASPSSARRCSGPGATPRFATRSAIAPTGPPRAVAASFRAARCAGRRLVRRRGPVPARRADPRRPARRTRPCM